MSRLLRLAPLLLLFLSLPAVAQISLEPDNNRFGTVRADGARISPSHWWDPYGPNVLKGDVPFDQRSNYLVLTAILDNQAFDNNAATGPSAQQRSLETVELAAEYFHGETVFRQKDVSLRLTGFFRDIHDPTERAQAVDAVGLGDNFLEVLLFESGGRSFDFTSARAGAQAFNLDFEGLIFNNELLGAKVFSQIAENRYDLAVAGGTLLQTDAKSLLTNPTVLQASVGFAQATFQDAFVPGFNLTAFAAFDDDLRDPGSVHQQEQVGWAGLASTGHLGRVVTAPAIYLAAGNEKDDNGSKSILAPMAVVDLALPVNAWTPRLTALWAPGDSNPNSSQATSFDALSDREAFAGAGGTGVLAGQGLAVPAPGNKTITLFRKGSVLPTLRGGNDPPNFVGGGLKLLDLGLDLGISPRYTLSLDVADFRWDQPSTVATIFAKTSLGSDDIGTEGIAALRYRPFLNDNAIIVLSAAGLSPGAGLSDLTGSSAAVLDTNVRILLAF